MSDVADATSGTLTGFVSGTVGDLQDAAGDQFIALGGNNSIVAGGGNDTINGGSGNDILRGGAGADGRAATSAKLADLINDNIGSSVRVTVTELGGVERSQAKARHVVDKRPQT